MRQKLLVSVLPALACSLSASRPGGRCRITMLRNIDRCEAVVFTRDVVLGAVSGELRPGAVRLISEAKEQGALIAILEPASRPLAADSPVHELLAGAPCWALQEDDPTIVEVNSLREALDVERPDGFGGSDGFGQAPGAAHGREPIAARCVVLVTTLRETVAALGAGMRAVAIPRVEGDWVDEALDGVADVCLDALGDDSDALALRLDDLSTPGSFWLNPVSQLLPLASYRPTVASRDRASLNAQIRGAQALPRDLFGNMVDPKTGLSLGTDDASLPATADISTAEGDEMLQAMLQRGPSICSLGTVPDAEEGLHH